LITRRTKTFSLSKLELQLAVVAPMGTHFYKTLNSYLHEIAITEHKKRNRKKKKKVYNVQETKCPKFSKSS
jgi:glucose/arabinose dehydrogenase